jgi:hypothetical protein
MTESSPRFGFVEFAETWNGRMAMLGFVIGLATEGSAPPSGVTQEVL